MRKLRWILFSVATIGVLLCVAVAGYQHASETALDAYAEWWAGDLVIEYLAAHDHRWPNDWDDLRGSFEAIRLRNGGCPLSFDGLRDRIVIDFTADPEQLRKVRQNSERLPFRVIYLKDGRDVYYDGCEPNTMVWEYLRSKKKL